VRIGIDARLLTGRYTGDRTYWRGLLTGLSVVDRANDYVLYTRLPSVEGDVPLLAPNFSWKSMPSRSDRAWSFRVFPRVLRDDHIDVAHVQYTVPPACPCPVVTTIHDISFRLLPHLFSFKDRFLLNLSIPGSIQRSAAVIAVSNSTRSDILASYPGTPADKVTAILEAASDEYRPQTLNETAAARSQLSDSYGVNGPYAVSVGVLQPRKNITMLVRAFAAAREKYQLPHVLVIVGKRGWNIADKEYDRLAHTDGVVMTGYVADTLLPGLYGAADVCLYPSLYEGFGLPVLEALSCGCPVICSNTSSLPEVAGNAAILLPPNDEGIWAERIGELLLSADMRTQMGRAGLAQAAHFDWKTTAERTLGVYNHVYARHRP